MDTWGMGRTRRRKGEARRRRRSKAGVKGRIKGWRGRGGSFFSCVE